MDRGQKDLFKKWFDIQKKNKLKKYSQKLYFYAIWKQNKKAPNWSYENEVLHYENAVLQCANAILH